MSMSQRLQEYLDSKNIRFELLPHYPAFPAQKTAQSLHVSGKHFARVYRPDYIPELAESFPGIESTLQSR